MPTLLLPEPSPRYVSKSQRIRVSSESWIASHLVCPFCGSRDGVAVLENNYPACDFRCNSCSELFQLKAGCKKNVRKINDGSYSAMLEAFNSRQIPSVLIMTYSYDSWSVTDLKCLPGFLFPRSSIVARKPLSKDARRAGWQGCVYDFSKISSDFFINLVSDGKFVSTEAIAESCNRLMLLRSASRASVWISEILRLVSSMPEYFGNDDIYAYADELRLLFPKNHNVEAKIRQQLQLLRDTGYVESLGLGRWRRLTGSGGRL